MIMFFRHTVIDILTKMYRIKGGAFRGREKSKER